MTRVIQGESDTTEQSINQSINQSLDQSIHTQHDGSVLPEPESNEQSTTQSTTQPSKLASNESSPLIAVIPSVLPKLAPYVVNPHITESDQLVDHSHNQCHEQSHDQSVDQSTHSFSGPEEVFSDFESEDEFDQVFDTSDEDDDQSVGQSINQSVPFRSRRSRARCRHRSLQSRNCSYNLSINMPLEILYHLSTYLEVPSLLALSGTHRSFTLDLNAEFWKWLFIDRWGSLYQVNGHTRVSASMHEFVLSLRSGSAFVWNAIEFSYSEGLIDREHKKHGTKGTNQSNNQSNNQSRQHTVPVSPRSTLPSLLEQGALSPPASNSQTNTNHPSVAQPTNQSINQKRANKCSMLARPIVASLMCPRHRDYHSRGRSLTRADVQSGHQWKIACIIRSINADEDVELRRCAICNELDIFTEEMKQAESARGCAEHGNTSWLSPCVCGTFTHRSCLEKITTWHFQQSIQSAINSSINSSLLQCETCLNPYHFAQRLPLSSYELLLATWRDRQWLSSKFFTVSLPVYILSMFVIFVLENARYAMRLPVNPALLLDPRPVDSLRMPMIQHYCFCIWHHLLICILFSNRFHSTVSRIFYTPLYLFYVKLYALMLFSFLAYFFSFIALPYPDVVFQWTRELRKYHDDSPLSAFTFNAVSISNFAFYCGCSTVLIYLFWKTEYRVATLRGIGDGEGVGQGRMGIEDGDVADGDTVLLAPVTHTIDDEHSEHECLTCGLVHFRSH